MSSEMQQETNKVDYEKLHLEDEPEILKLGSGDQVRDLLDAVLGAATTYDAKALFKTCVTMRTLKSVFEAARIRKFGQDGPYWLGSVLKYGKPMYFLHPTISSPDKKSIWYLMEMKKYSKALLLLFFQVDGQLTELHKISMTRFNKVIDVLGSHAELSFLMAGIRELAVQTVEAEKLGWSTLGVPGAKPDFTPEQCAAIWRAIGKSPGTEQELHQIRLDQKVKFDQLIDEMEKAVMSGDLDWFLNRYSDTVGDPEPEGLDKEFGGKKQYVHKICYRCHRCHDVGRFGRDSLEAEYVDSDSGFPSSAHAPLIPCYRG